MPPTGVQLRVALCCGQGGGNVCVPTMQRRGWRIPRHVGNLSFAGRVMQRVDVTHGVATSRLRSHEVPYKAGQA
eukprot:gene9096-biopygen6707